MNEQERTMSFLFVRIHFTEVFGPSAKAALYENLMKIQERKEEVKGYYWAFGDIGNIAINTNELIFGRLGKTAKSRFEVIYDEERHKYKKELLNIQKANYSNFFIDAENNIIAYEESPYISRHQFLKHFSKIWFDTVATKIEFEFLLLEAEIIKILRSWDRIITAKFKLKPTNPSSYDDFKPLDEFIRCAKAEKAKLEFMNEADGLNLTENTPIHQGLSMASAGYGDFEVRGLKGKVGQRVSSKGLQIRRDFIHIDDLEALSPAMMKEIRKIVEAMNR